MNFDEFSFDFFPFEEDLATAGIHYSDWHKFSNLLEQDYTLIKLDILKIFEQISIHLSSNQKDSFSLENTKNLKLNWDIGEIYLLKFVNMSFEKKKR